MDRTRITYLSPISDGPTQDWDVWGGAPSAYAAVEKDKGSVWYISTSTATALTSFEHGNGSVPRFGLVAQIALGYIARPTGAGGTAELAVGLYRNGSVLSSTTHTVTTDDQIVGHLNMPVDPSTSARFTAPDLEDLESRFEAVSFLGGGSWIISEAWIEVEWIPVPQRYDPVQFAVTPDSLSGDLVWNTTGGEMAIVGASNLQITDTDPADWREYSRNLPVAYPTTYTTEMSSRMYLASAMTGPAFVYRIARIEDGAKDIDLCAFIDSSGNKKIGVAGGSLDRDDPSDYKGTYEIDWTITHHYRLSADRNSDPGQSKNVQVFVDHAEDPVIELLYSDMETAGSNQLSFGTGNAGLTTSQVTANIAYVDWWTYKSFGESFAYWYDIEDGVSSVAVNSSDTYIATKQRIDPPGIEVGESNYCCELMYGAPGTYSAVITYVPVLDSADTYDLVLDHRTDTALVQDAVSIQRTSDYYYWNNGTSSWQAGVSAIILTDGITRTRVTKASSIQTSTPDDLIITIRTDPSGRSAAHSRLIYHVHLSD